MTPHSEAIADRIWAYAEPRGWNCTCGEIADALDVSPKLVSSIIVAKNWTGKLQSPFHLRLYTENSATRTGEPFVGDAVRAHISAMVEGFDK